MTTTANTRGRTPMDSQEQAFALTRKVYDPVETHFTPGERSMVAWISCDNVDHERDVVVASGVDFKTYFLGKTPAEGNPVVLAVHDFGRWPLGKCAWIQLKKNGGFNGLYAKTVFDGDEEAEKVWGKIRAKSLRGISIGFRPPDDLQPGEWGPPTKDELLRRPDWQGAERIIRRCVLLEYSVCSLPMNPRALVDAVNKGLHRPVYSLKSPEAPMEPEVDDDEDKAAKPCGCGEKGCEKCKEQMATKEEEEDEEEDAETKAATDADFEVAAEAPDEDDEEDETDLPVKTRDHVDIKSKGFRGHGIVEKIHRKGLVDHVDEDVMGTKDDPAARVQLYKAHGDGHAPTERRMGVAVKCLTKRAEPFKAPSKKATEIAETKAESADPSLGPLPEIKVQSDQEVRAELVAKLNAMLSPDGFRKIAREEIERITGVV